MRRHVEKEIEALVELARHAKAMEAELRRVGRDMDAEIYARQAEKYREERVQILKDEVVVGAMAWFLDDGMSGLLHPACEAYHAATSSKIG